MTWVKIKQNENYSINENGEVRNNANGKIKKQYICKGNGYLYVDLWKDNKGNKFPIHRLLATAFMPNPQNKPTVRPHRRKQNKQQSKQSKMGNL